jgi:hypothetical protein
MNNEAFLPEEMLWDGEHASELAREAIADLQMDIVPREVVAHVEGCRHCSLSIGEAALRSRAMGQVWAVAPADSVRLDSGKATYPLPWRALFGALFLGTAGVTPALLALPHFVSQVASTASHSVPVVASVTVATAELHGGTVLAVSGTAAAILVASALALLHWLRSSAASSSPSPSPSPSPPESPKSPRSS